MKLGIFDLSADVKDGITTLRVTDYSRRLVACGKGANINEAREDAMAMTEKGGC